MASTSTAASLVNQHRQDLRHKFLSVESKNLLCGMAKFADEYVRGIHNVTQVNLHNCENLKSPHDLAVRTMCDKCQTVFRGPPFTRWLFCAVNFRISFDNTKQKRDQKFKLVCEDCAQNYILHPEFQVYELYPRIHLKHVLELCRHGFIRKYFLPINPDLYSERRVDIVRNETYKVNDIYATIQDIISNKNPHEQITKISFRTIGRVFFDETFEDMFVEKRGTISVVPGPSKMLEFLSKPFDFTPNFTYYYHVHVAVGREKQRYVMYLEIPCLRYCKLCTLEKQHKGYPVVWCSVCGYTDTMYYDEEFLHFQNMEYESFRLRPMYNKKKTECIIYYKLPFMPPSFLKNKTQSTLLSVTTQ